MTKHSELQPEGEQSQQTSETAPAGNADALAGRKPKKEYDIDIFRGWCKSCGICAAFCPRECIRIDEEGSPFVEDSSKCTGCGWCELHCPDFAISVRPKKTKPAPAEED